MMDSKIAESLDWHITGNYGEDQFPEVHEPDPDTWAMVVRQSDLVVVSAMCICGNDDCLFTGTVYRNQLVNVTKNGWRG